ncbi:hypothetical protein ACIQMJ_08885 [Actinosynnema sp. NPDC091369]
MTASPIPDRALPADGSVQHCTVHNTLRRAPEIVIEMTEVES